MGVGNLTAEEEKVVLEMRQKSLEESKNFKEGAMIILTTGSYDDYRIAGSFIVKNEFNVDDQLAKWAVVIGREFIDGEVGFKDDGRQEFLPWLLSNGFTVEAVCREVRYGTNRNQQDTRFVC